MDFNFKIKNKKIRKYFLKIRIANLKFKKKNRFFTKNL